MKTEFSIKDLLESLHSAMQGVSANIFLTTRPQSVSEQMQDFIVITLPVTIYSKTYGTGYGWCNTFCRIEVYVKDKNNREDILRLDNLVNMILGKFPISDSNLLALNPRVMMAGSDGKGFHAAFIQATIQTK